MKSFDIVVCKVPGNRFDREFLIVSYGEQENLKYANLVDVTDKGGQEIVHVIHSLPMDERDTDLSVDVELLENYFEFKAEVRA